MDTPDMQSASPEIHFPDTQLVAVPTLELIGHCPKDGLSSLHVALKAWMLRTVVFPTGIEVATLITHEQGMTVHAGLVDEVLLDALRSEFVDASAFPIRTQPVTILINCKRNADPVQPCATSARITVGDNIFPDDPLTISICLRSSAASAWTDLLEARSAISAILDRNLLCSTLGYGFTCDFEQAMQVSPSMENLCMRYLGIDLNDPFGNFTLLMPRGLRSINWQIGIPERRLSSLAPAQSSTLLAGSMLEAGVRYWKTGEKPSTCDRNLISDHQSIAEYAALDRQLASLKCLSSCSWMPNWRDDTFERWQNRWTDVLS